MKNSDILSNMLLDGFKDEDSDPIDIKFILYQYLKYWWLFLIAIVVCVSLAALYLFYATPLYSSSASLLIKSDTGIGFTQNAVFSDLDAYESSSKVENELEVLSSYSLMFDAIEDMPLDASFFTKDKYGRTREIYSKHAPVEVVIHEHHDDYREIPENRDLKIQLHQDNFLLELSDGRQQSTNYGEKIDTWYGILSINKTSPLSESTPKDLIVKLTNKSQLASRYSSALRLQLSNKYASVVNLSLTDAVPERSRDILNQLIDAYNYQAVKEKNIIATNTLQFIDEQLSSLTKELDDIERKIEGYKRSYNISDLKSEISNHVEGSGQYGFQLSKNRTQIEILESIEYALNDTDGMGAEVASTLTIEDQTLSSQVARYNQLLNDRAMMLRTAQPSNPLVLNLDEEITSLKRNILTNLSNIKNGLLIEVRNLQGQVAQLDQRVKEVPEIERGLLELTREQEIKQEHYLYLVKKREESQLSLAATTVSNSRVIDAAASSGAPVSPNKKVIIAFSMLLGFGAPFGFIYLKNALTTKILQKQDVKKLTSIPIIAEISHNEGKDILAISEKRRTPIAEQFRLLRTNLRFKNGGKEDRVVLVTSNISGEGKTFFSLNFGVSLSLTGKKVVVLEFDLRKPALLKSISQKRGIGITDYLNSPALTIEDIIIDFEPAPNLSIIGCGSLPDDPAELMLHPRIETLIAGLKDKFDHIILDTAPVGTVADAFNIVPFTDYSLFLIRYNYTQKGNIRFMEEINMQNKLKRPFIVLNDAKLGAGNYGYVYGYGYEDKSKVYS